MKRSSEKAMHAKKRGSGPIMFYDIVQRKKVSVSRDKVKFTTNKRGRDVMIAKDQGTLKNGGKYNLHKIGHA